MRKIFSNFVRFPESPNFTMGQLRKNIWGFKATLFGFIFENVQAKQFHQRYEGNGGKNA